jgi:hypothetical protein
MVIREQEPGRHRLSGAPHRNPDVVISERGPDRHHLSDALYRRSKELVLDMSTWKMVIHVPEL